MQMPKKALVLAAGLGTRLRPLTLVYPKPLMPVWNVPLLEHTLQLLESWGVEEIAVNTHWMAELIDAWLKKRQGRAQTRISFESEILGTGGALRPLKTFFEHEPFWMMNADIAASVNPEPFVNAFEASGSLASAWLEPKKGPRTVEMDYAGRITCWRSPTPGVEHTYTFCGLQLVSPRIYDFLPDAAFSTIVDAYQRAMDSNLFVRGVSVKGSYWDDAGTVASYLRIHADIKKLAQTKKPGGEWYDAAADRFSAKDKSFFCVSPQAKVPKGVKGIDSVVTEGATVLAGASLKDCVIAGGVTGGEQKKGVHVRAQCVCDAALCEAITHLGWTAESTGAHFLGARGSDRSFWRLSNGTQSVIAVQYALTRAENARYSSHAELLAAAGVPVPAIKLDRPDIRVLMLEDCGDDSLQQRMQRKVHPHDEQWYEATVKALARFHQEGTRVVRERQTVLEPAFDEALYAWEHRLFEEHLLNHRYGYDAVVDLRRGDRRGRVSRPVRPSSTR